jgi:predicted ester cyclase
MTELDARPVPAQRDAASRETARRYLAAWNARDGASVAAVVTGSYVDPTLPTPLRGDDLAAYVDGLCAAFPDLHFSEEAVYVDGEHVVAQWRMRGTNSGSPLPGAPQPTNGTIDLPGVDVMHVVDGVLQDVVGYFDQKAFIEQLGLRALVVPNDEWPVSFGTSSRVDLSNTTHPGGLTVTWIEVDEADDAELVRQTIEIVTALAGEPGFIGMQTTDIGRRKLTLTMWSSPDAAASAVARVAPHQRAQATMLSDNRDFGFAGFTSIWQPFRINAQFRACPDCGRYASLEPGQTTATCSCSGTINAAPYI